MKDIFNKPTEPLDLSEADSQVYSPYTLDLSAQVKNKPTTATPRQTNFYEYMPGVMQNAGTVSPRDDERPHPDDEFGEKLAYWYESAVNKLRGLFSRASLYVMAALKPLRLYWAVAVGVGLILGLLIISYIATHRNWITSFPTATQSKAAGSIQSDKAQSPAVSPGKGGANGVQSATPAAAVGSGAGGGAGTAGAAAAGSGSTLPSVGGVNSSGYSAGNTQTYTGPTSGGSTTNIVQSAPVQAPVSTPVPVTAPAPTPLPILEPVNNTLSPVKSLL